MRIQVLFFSHSGNTRALIDQLMQDKQLEHVQFDIIDIQVTQPETFIMDGDKVLLATCVQQFSLNPTMKAWLAKLPKQPTKPMAVFLMHGLSQKWIGFNQAKKAICSSKALSDQAIEEFFDLSEKQRRSQSATESVVSAMVDWVLK